MEKKENRSEKKLFGLLGKNISYSFSREYFTKKFKKLNLKDYQYVNFDIQSIDEFPKIIRQFKGKLGGLNITTPYKESVLQYLNKIDEKAKNTGAVNTIRITRKGKLKGYNTDIYGFKKSFYPLLQKHHKKALILGTGGASKAIAFILNELKITFKFVSRNPKNDKEICYSNLTEDILNSYQILINCSPVGTFPAIKDKPKIPYQFLSNNHLLYDLIYNPSITTFLSEGKEKGATIKNGLEMLELQANKSWKIWNKSKK